MEKQFTILVHTHGTAYRLVKTKMAASLLN